ncbi:uncharacterized protein BDW47DRAFT_132819 [Aspergillus candidus]|uniref:Ima1 N-terminal domain-domain-containing protein n=1 Tax=Aspergillus candidus TaxID=41067 RepID=A0A2I2F6X3_ASPCN|nr:Ima1 N-terminal domain-domain-containing protein [Aspergillus candidus]PLB36361.1 Ima1 N-terminal domain-domain-containing protein [Aspergillus candidus]
MATLFSKRLNCFYCGRRSAQTTTGPVRKWHCQHCEAVNYLDENGEITDPPAAETNAQVDGFGAPGSTFESSDFSGSGVFCGQCLRNQHLFTNALASYLPPSDDPDYCAYERGYPSFRKNLEERYPQVCANCEPRVRERIRQSGYEAKSDHLRRVIDRSKAGRAARQSRTWNWRSLLVFAGAVGYWTSIAGQLCWDAWSALATEELHYSKALSSSPTVSAWIQRIAQNPFAPSSRAIDLAPYARLSLVAGILTLWYNPKLRLKVEGRGGRFVGLGEYYKVQLIVMVVRCAFWAMLKDPASSGLEPALPPALHLFMILFTVLSVAISRRVVQYDTRPLVTWSELDSAPTPKRDAETTPVPNTANKQVFGTPSEGFQTAPRFPIEKLATPRQTPLPSLATDISIPTPPPEDDMDWTPSVQHNIRPTVSVHQRDQPSVLDGPMPFYGSIPAAPEPPAWTLRNRSKHKKPLEEVVEPNPFHRTPATQASRPWQRGADRSENVFAPPKFFPMSDHASSTGLESLFDRTFTIKSPEDEEDSNWKRQQKQQQRTSNAKQRLYPDFQGAFVFQYLRIGLLLASLFAWVLSQYEHLSVTGNYIEVASLGSASLIAGFGLLEVLKQPIVQWNGMEILVYLAELSAAVHLGGNLPHVSLERQYFDRYGKLLLIFMAVQEALGLLALYQAAQTHSSTTQENRSKASQPNRHESFDDSPGTPRPKQIAGRPEFGSFTSQTSAAPPLSFSSTAAGSSFQTQPPEPRYQIGRPSYDGPFDKGHGFSLSSLKGDDSDAYDPLEHDSDTETTATTATDSTIRNIRYGGSTAGLDTPFFSPRRSDLGPGIGGLSLDDKPSMGRVTRSQTKGRLRR